MAEEQQTAPSPVPLSPVEVARIAANRKRGPKLHLTKELITSVLAASVIDKLKYSEISAKYNLNYSQIKVIERDYLPAFMETIQVNNIDVKTLKDYWVTQLTPKSP